MRRRAERLFPLCKIRDETDSMAKAKLTKSSSYGVLRQSPYFKSDSVNCVIKEKKEQKKMLSYGTVHIHWRTYTRYVYIKMIYIYTHMEINKKNIYVVDSIESMIIYYMSN